MRIEQPGGALESGRVAVEAGIWGGERGEQVQCFDVAQLAPPPDWRDHVVWRDAEGALTPVRVAPADATLAAHCAG